MGILMLNGNNYTGGIQQVYGSSSGAIATFTDGGNNKPLKSLKVAINPVQDLHGYDHPWVGGAGKNKLPIDEVIHSNSTGDINIFSGSISGTYTISIDTTEITSVVSPNASVLKYIVDGTERYMGYNVGHVTFTGELTKITVFSATTYCKYIGKAKFQLEEGSTVTAWQPYSNICPISGWDEVKVVVSPTTDAEDGTTYTIQLGSTCYGGELDVKSGVLTVDKKSVDMGSLTWTYHPASGSYTDYFDTNSMPSDSEVGNRDVIADILCEIYKPITSTNIAHTGYDNSVMALAHNTRRLIVCDQRFTSASDLQTALDGVMLVYALATPQEIQLTPTEVKTLLGNNNIWSDTGEIVECVYQRDLNLVINQFDARITALEQALSGTRSLSLSKSAVKEEETEEITEEPKEEEQNEDKR